MLMGCCFNVFILLCNGAKLCYFFGTRYSTLGVERKRTEKLYFIGTRRAFHIINTPYNYIIYQ